jgi:hypothetical protein
MKVDVTRAWWCCDLLLCSVRVRGLLLCGVRVWDGRDRGERVCLLSLACSVLQLPLRV